MEKLKYLSKMYLDKEKDVIINFYFSNKDEITYIIETPNHNTGNLITNLAKLCKLNITKNDKGMKIIKGKILASINGDNEEVYILRLGGIKIANIYTDGGIAIKAMMPAIIKTLMSQTKNYDLDIRNTLVKAYILKKSKFRTDIHTHMNAILPADCLIALGLRHQIKYPLYYIKKLDIKITPEQEKRIYKQREKVEKEFNDSKLKGKNLIRRIDDNTFINFADVILNNPKNAKENILKIKRSLEILKDGQAVFTNLEKLYLYRYVFAKGKESKEKIELNINKIEEVLETDIKKILIEMIKDSKDKKYSKNVLRQNKLLWIAREYKKQGIEYVEISDTQLTKKGIPAIEFLEEIHEIMPKIEEETGVKIRFLYAFRRVPLTIIKDNITEEDYLRENIQTLKAIGKSPYVVGSDFIGEEINDISDLKPAIAEIVEYVQKEDSDFTIKIHAGENDSLRQNVGKSIECIKESLKPGQTMPRCRIGHGLYVPELDTTEGKKLIKEINEAGAVLEFQLTSNVRLNNLSSLQIHPLKKYLESNMKCVQGTDGCGFYGIDTIDEQLALQNILGLDENDFEKMRKVENEIIEHSEKYFKKKSQKFEKFLNGRTIRKALLDYEEKIENQKIDKTVKLRINDKVLSEHVLKDKIKELPKDKIPIIIAGGSFNRQGKETIITEEGKRDLTELIKKINIEKAFFIIGHKMQGYEKLILDISKELKKQIEVYSIIPKLISKEIQKRLNNKDLDGICISIESEEFGIYKSFNYEIFERRESIVIAFDGNSPVSNLIQEAKNGKGKAIILVNEDNKNLRDKAKMLEGYLIQFNRRKKVNEIIFKEKPELEEK